MSSRRCLGFLWLFSTASSVAAPSASAPSAPLVVELELAPDARAQTTLFAVIEELGLRVPLERVREPFRCNTRYVDDQSGQAIDVSCDPTQRTASRITNSFFAGQPEFIGDGEIAWPIGKPSSPATRSDISQPSWVAIGLLSIAPRRCSENCSRYALPAPRHLELRLPIRGEVPATPCPEGAKTTPVDFRFERRQRVDSNSAGVLARLPFLFLTSSSPALAIPVSWHDVRSTKCRAKPSPSELVVTCGEQVFVAKQTGNRISFDDGSPRGVVVLPCGKRARWPKLP